MNFQSIGAPVRENGGVFTAAHDPLYPSSAKTIVFTDEKAPENFAFSCEIKLCRARTARPGSSAISSR